MHIFVFWVISCIHVDLSGFSPFCLFWNFSSFSSQSCSTPTKTPPRARREITHLNIVPDVFPITDRKQHEFCMGADREIITLEIWTSVESSQASMNQYRFNYRGILQAFTRAAKVFSSTHLMKCLAVSCQLKESNWRADPELIRQIPLKAVLLSRIYTFRSRGDDLPSLLFPTLTFIEKDDFSFLPKQKIKQRCPSSRSSDSYRTAQINVHGGVAFVLETQNKKASDIKHSEPLTENTIIDRLYSPRTHRGRNTERNDRLGGYTAL